MGCGNDHPLWLEIQQRIQVWQQKDPRTGRPAYVDSREAGVYDPHDIEVYATIPDSMQGIQPSLAHVAEADDADAHNSTRRSFQ
jgi:hypothetical protein